MLDDKLPKDEQKKTLWRIPAEDLEQAVVTQLIRLIEDEHTFSKTFALEKLSSHTLIHCAKNCHQIANKLSMEVDEKYDTLRDIIEK